MAEYPVHPGGEGIKYINKSIDLKQNNNSPHVAHFFAFSECPWCENVKFFVLWRTQSVNNEIFFFFFNLNIQGS